MEPFLAEPLVVRLHVVAALFALAFGPLVIYRRRRDVVHKVMGYAWVATMAGVAVSGLLIPAGILPLAFGYGVIHVLAVLLLVGLASGVAAIRTRQRAKHERMMRMLYWQVMGITGLFTLLPGRLMNELLFAAWPQAGWVAILVGLGVIGWISLRENLWMRTKKAR